MLSRKVFDVLCIIGQRIKVLNLGPPHLMYMADPYVINNIFIFGKVHKDEFTFAFMKTTEQKYGYL